MTNPTEYQIDIAADSEDFVQVEDQKRADGSRVLYVHLNGVTILRICRLKVTQRSHSVEM